jgi:hypothetical protein
LGGGGGGGQITQRYNYFRNTGIVKRLGSFDTHRYIIDIFSQILELFSQLNVAVCSRSTLYALQSVFVNQIVYSKWIRMQETLLAPFQLSGRPLSVSGDGQYDSPGFSASYCFYSMVETGSKKIIDFYVAEKSMTEYSAKMESFATKIILSRLHKKKINIRVCTTDRSGQLKSMLKAVNQEREKRGLLPIKHCFDVWHYVKSVSKDVFAAAKLKKCAGLSCWIRSIRNMMWYSFSECKGDAELLQEMILSIPKHIAGVHVFPENRLFKRCLHGDLSTERSKPWLREGSLSMKKLLLAIRGHKDSRLKDLAMMTEFQHTGTNEQINNLHNVYLPKSCSFGHKQAVVRACLTAIDHNYNVDRRTALDVDGEERYNIISSRDGQIWTAKIVKEPKNTSWRQEILDEVVEAVRCQEEPGIEIPTDNHLKRYGKKLPKPDKSITLAATKENRRFKELRQLDDTSL